MDAVERVVSALVKVTGHQPRKRGLSFTFRCPAHEDDNPSLIVSPGRDQPVVLHCFAGCATVDILAALGLNLEDISENGFHDRADRWTPAGPATAVYDYRDENGLLLFQVCRTASKDFRQRIPDPDAKSGWRWSLGDTRRVLYRLPEVIKGVQAGEVVWITEGEKDADRLADMGVCATTNPGGAGKWREDYSKVLAGADVVICADDDLPGLTHARQVAAALTGVARSVVIRKAAIGKDISDHLAAGKLLAETLVIDAAPGPGDEPEAQELWDARPVLAHLRQFAWARRVSPLGLLGVVLARVVAQVPAHVVLPPLVGGYGSLNLFVALVGSSGGGKGGVTAAARDALDLGEINFETHGVGSGEGVLHAYARLTKNGVEQHTDAVLFSVPEVDTLTALGGRQGSTLLPTLRSAWTGEQLSFHYVDPTKRLAVKEHCYRMALVCGVQPGRAEGLLHDVDAGTPQRFVWLPVDDPQAPDVPPTEPKPWPLALPARFTLPYQGHQAMGVCQTAVDEIDAARLARLRGQVAELEGHAMLARLKVAGALAVLDGRANILDDDWLLAQKLMTVSTGTRGRIQEVLKTEVRRRNTMRGKEEAERQAIVEEEVIKRACGTIRRYLAREKGWVLEGKVRQALNSSAREQFGEAVGRLLRSGAIEARTGERRVQYRVTSKDRE